MTTNSEAAGNAALRPMKSKSKAPPPINPVRGAMNPMKFESDANRLLRYARELKQIYRDRRIAQDELKCPTQEERGTPIEQIKVFMDKYKVTKYSLAKTMGLSDSDKKKLYRYFKGKTKCLPSGGINRIAAALTELCGQKISFSD